MFLRLVRIHEKNQSSLKMQLYQKLYLLSPLRLFIKIHLKFIVQWKFHFPLVFLSLN
jgi:hypothetical protein